MDAPVYRPWDPRNELPPDQRNGINGALRGWSNLMYVITQKIPQAWNEIGRLL